MTEYDVIMIGAGHNGLTCANHLGRAGKRVLVLEAAAEPGGCAATREFAPGFSASSCAQWLTQLSPRVVRDFELENHGLRWAARDLATVGLAEDGNHLVLRTAGVEGGGLSNADREAYRAFHSRMLRYAGVLAGLLATRPPKLVDGGVTDRLNLFKTALGIRRLGVDEMREFMRIVLMNMYDLMHEHFEHPALQAMLSLDGVIGARMGPRSPGSVFGYLYRLTGEVAGCDGPAQLHGGMGSLGAAMAASARAAGVAIRTGARVARIDTHAGRATGVTLEDGEQLRAGVVVSNADPVTTFERLVGYDQVETGVARRVSQIRNAGAVAKLHLGLGGPPQFTGLPDALLGHRLLVAPDMDTIERAFNPVKYNEYAADPVLDISVASVNDPGLAPQGQHVLSAIVPFVPQAPEGGWDSHRQPVIDGLLACLERYAPGISGQVVAAELLTPTDLERDYGMRGGHWHHGELALDQFLTMRPFPGASQYAMPVDGLFLCGAGAHPGGGLNGLAGGNAAREILRRERGR